MKDVTIPDGVTSIGDYAFFGCDSLTCITIPDGVKSIGKGAFYGCDGLTGIAIGAGVTDIGENAFYECYRLAEIYDKSNLDLVAGSADNGCVGFYAKNVYTPTDGESKLKTDENGFVTCGGNMLVDYVGKATEITVPYGVTAINGYAFYNRRNLSGITIPDGVTLVGDYAFSECSGLTGVTLGNGVKSIGNYAFSGCGGLTDVTIGSSVTGIGFSAFEKCYALNTIKYTGGIDGWCRISNLNDLMVSGTRSKKLYVNGKEIAGKLTIPDDVTRISAWAFYDCVGLTDVIIPDSVTEIGEAAFEYCCGVTSLTIGKNVAGIGYSAFRGCSGLTDITVVNGNTKYHSEGDCLIATASKSLILGCENSIIPADGSVTDIGAYAFQGCTGLTAITIPVGVTHIGFQAFASCNNLRNFIFNGTVEQWKAIDNWTGLSYDYTVTCTDGTLDRRGNVIS